MLILFICFLKVFFLTEALCDPGSEKFYESFTYNFLHQT